MESKHLPVNHLDFEPTPGLGCLSSFDPRDNEFKMGAEVPLETTRSKQLWNLNSEPLNQGQTFKCTAYSAEHYLMADPCPQAPYMTADKLYVAAQRNDEWPGEEPTYQGSSVRAAFKVLKAAGYIDTYVWANDADTVRRWVLMKSPVVVGTNWYSMMSSPSYSGFIRAKGSPVGGHAYCIIGADDSVKCPDGTRGMFVILNSWGRWGYKKTGRAFISYKDMDGLIKNHGSAVTAVEICPTVTPIDITGEIK